MLFEMRNSKYQKIESTLCILDVDECEPSRCHDNATCQNTIGSFTCRCIDNFRGNGFECEGKNISLVFPYPGL